MMTFDLTFQTESEKFKKKKYKGIENGQELFNEVSIGRREGHQSDLVGGVKGEGKRGGQDPDIGFST